MARSFEFERSPNKSGLFHEIDVDQPPLRQGATKRIAAFHDDDLFQMKTALMIYAAMMIQTVFSLNCLNNVCGCSDGYCWKKGSKSWEMINSCQQDSDCIIGCSKNNTCLVTSDGWPPEKYTNITCQTSNDCMGSTAQFLKEKK